MLKRLAVLVLALAAFAGLSRAAETGPVLTGEELRKTLEGNTVWVVRQDFTVGDEYHLPDGRVFGFNGVETVVDGCWDIVGNEVCYYYKDDFAKGVAHCWTFSHAKPDGFYLKVTKSNFGGYGRMEKGNPRNYTDNGRPWVCKRLLSQTQTRHILAAR